MWTTLWNSGWTVGFFRALKKPDSSLGITGSYRHDILALHTVFLTSLLGS